MIYKRFIKRIFDFILSLIGFIIISPIFIILWIWLTIANKGAGALFFQERPGKGEKVFKVIKFKRMDEEVYVWGYRLLDVDRCSMCCCFFCSTFVDLILLFLNLFRGDMSFIGPISLWVYYLPL